MRFIVAAALLSIAVGANAQEYPSCDLKAQHALKGDLGGSITDPRQAHISVRANILQADLGDTRRARHLSQAETDRLFKRVDSVRIGADRYTKRQGFLSAAEFASYDRELDAISANVCRR